jgi:large subunit ribosomal protein L3
MGVGILGKKIGMTQIFDEEGQATPVTVIQSGPCIITQIKNLSDNGYNAIQLGFFPKKLKHTNKAEQGQFNKIGCTPMRFLKEFRVQSVDNFILGQTITVDSFEIGQFVNVQGRSIGKGFTSLQKRHNFARGPMTHGSKNHREPGSIGAGTTPGRVFPGKKMSGQHGNSNITISNLKILGIDNNENLLLLKGAIPGKSGNLVSIEVSKK